MPAATDRSTDKPKVSASPEEPRKMDPHWMQQRWLSAAKGKPVEILLMNGQTVQGGLVGADQYSVWVKEESGRVAMIYKHACAVLRRTAGEADNGESGKP